MQIVKKAVISISEADNNKPEAIDDSCVSIIIKDGLNIAAMSPNLIPRARRSGAVTEFSG
jgi:hypothetical protein